MGNIEKLGIVIVSIKRELKTEVSEDQFLCILRIKDADDIRVTISSSLISQGFLAGSSFKTLIPMINPNLQAKHLHKVTDPKIETKLCSMDEIKLVRKFKFGVLYVKEGQVTEEEMFGNGYFI